MTRAEIIAIGSELTSGERLDTNSQWLSRRLEALGIAVHRHTTIGDVFDENVEVFREASRRSDLVVVSGGLGPTQDDLTREALAAAAGVKLVEDAASIVAIEALFARRNRVMPERNRIQALLPEGAEALFNRVGTAPGVALTFGNADFACLPGVPYEMTIMFDEQVVPRLKSQGRVNRVIAHRVICLFGKGESEIESAALDLTVRGRRPEVGITASDATISFRISCDGADEAEALQAIEPTLVIIRERFADLIIGESEGADVANALVDQLQRHSATLATADSCTGGLVAERITAIPGASACFLGGVVSYANEAKQTLLGVPEELLNAHGAVSAPVAEAMAAGIRDRLGATIGLSITGIAGPDGGSPEKPVGLVFLGLATPRGVSAKRLELGPEQPRQVIQSRAAKQAMNWVRITLKHQHLDHEPSLPPSSV